MVISRFCLGYDVPSLINQSGNGTGPATSVPVQCTNQIGTNALMWSDIDLNDVTLSDRAISTVTWIVGITTQNMTRAYGPYDDGVSKVKLGYYVLNPTTGVGTNRVTTAGTCNGLSCITSTFGNIAQINQTNAIVGHIFATTTTPSQTITNTVANCLMISGINKFLTSGTDTPSAAETTILNGAIGSSHWADSTYVVGTTNGIYNFSRTFSITSACEMGIVAFTPSGSALPQQGPLMGVWP